MKKIWFMLINLFVFTISLSGCTKYYHYDFEEIAGFVEEIYIVEVERTEYYGDISIDYLMEIEEDFADFLNELKSLEFKNNEQTCLHNAKCNEEDFNEILNKYYK